MSFPPHLCPLPGGERKFKFRHFKILLTLILPACRQADPQRRDKLDFPPTRGVEFKTKAY
ncbi:MAG: hypothetical protein A2042_06640 [Candidatus Schekmanbacteria bacterium GWA2_38_11]|uniref:Uncharacterized protein n=1 Tax=Candidatus Schekmanbacteria bacterium GWA2_38_11 TaxID=1817876 RepID=A0A1F7RAX1_9BACT|nr:MAG: hypothetical protein A2042_06640 [Candidatus Schekmanbacteria bacterium GWA2_38_11]